MVRELERGLRGMILWEKEHDDFLWAHRTWTNEDLALVLGCSPQSVRSRRNLIGARKKRTPRKKPVYDPVKEAPPVPERAPFYEMEEGKRYRVQKVVTGEMGRKHVREIAEGVCIGETDDLYIVQHANYVECYSKYDPTVTVEVDFD